MSEIRDAANQTDRTTAHGQRGAISSQTFIAPLLGVAGALGALTLWDKAKTTDAPAAVVSQEPSETLLPKPSNDVQLSQESFSGSTMLSNPELAIPRAEPQPTTLAKKFMPPTITAISKIELGNDGEILVNITGTDNPRIKTYQPLCLIRPDRSSGHAYTTRDLSNGAKLVEINFLFSNSKFAEAIHAQVAKDLSVIDPDYKGTDFQIRPMEVQSVAIKFYNRLTNEIFAWPAQDGLDQESTGPKVHFYLEADQYERFHQSWENGEIEIEGAIFYWSKDIARGESNQQVSFLTLRKVMEDKFSSQIAHGRPIGRQDINSAISEVMAKCSEGFYGDARVMDFMKPTDAAQTILNFLSTEVVDPERAKRLMADPALSQHLADYAQVLEVIDNNGRYEDVVNTVQRINERSDREARTKTFGAGISGSFTSGRFGFDGAADYNQLKTNERINRVLDAITDTHGVSTRWDQQSKQLIPHEIRVYNAARDSGNTSYEMNRTFAIAVSEGVGVITPIRRQREDTTRVLDEFLAEDDLAAKLAAEKTKQQQDAILSENINVATQLYQELSSLVATTRKWETRLAEQNIGGMSEQINTRCKEIVWDANSHAHPQIRMGTRVADCLFSELERTQFSEYVSKFEAEFKDYTYQDNVLNFNLLAALYYANSPVAPTILNPESQVIADSLRNLPFMERKLGYKIVDQPSFQDKDNYLVMLIAELTESVRVWSDHASTMEERYIVGAVVRDGVLLMRDVEIPRIIAKRAEHERQLVISEMNRIMEEMKSAFKR